MTRLLNQANQDMRGGSPFPTPGNTSQNRQIWVHLPPELLSSWTSGRERDVGASSSLQETSSRKTPSSEEVDYERGRRSQEASLNLSGQLKKVHDLG